jgi:hypothetical protein
MIAVGMLRWFFNLQRKEIQLLLAARGTNISTGEISNLSEEFLLRFYVLHRKHIPKLNELFDKKGGMVFHLDGTGEAGDEIVFSVKEGTTGITIDAQIMPAESLKYLKFFLQKLKDSFGIPIAVVRDMSKQIQYAVTEIFPTVLQLICHYHFVKNLGKIIFKERYEIFRNSMVDTKVLGQLVALKERLLHDTSSNKLVKGERTWTALAIEYLLWPRETASGYPFVLPYFEIMNRTLKIKELINRIVKWNGLHNIAVEAIIDLSERIDYLTTASDIQLQYFRIKRIYGWFVDVRNVLGISRNLSGNGQNNEPMDIEIVKEDIKNTLDRIENEGREIGGKLISPSKEISRQFKNHWDELFEEVIGKIGKPIKIVRHNGIEERNHRWSRMHTRRRTGRSRTTNEMAKYGALLSVLSNLENKLYVENVLNDVKDFVYELQNITPEEIKEANKTIKPYLHKQMVRSDKTRVKLLQEFVEILECSEEKNDTLLQDWLSKLKNLTEF